MAEIGVVTGIAVDTFVAKLATFAEGTVGAIGEGAGIFAVVSLLAVAGVETHVTILGNGGDIAVVAIFAGASPGAALGGFHEECAEVGDEGLRIDHGASLVEGDEVGKERERRKCARAQIHEKYLPW